MNPSWMQLDKPSTRPTLTIYILVIIAIISVANVLANRYNKSYDSTVEQALQPVRPDRQDRQGLEARRHHHLFRQDQRFQTGQGSARPLCDAFAPRSTSIYVDPDKNPQAARAAADITELRHRRRADRRQKRRSQEHDGRRYYRRDHPRPEKQHAHGLLSSRAAASTRLTTPTATATRSSRISLTRTTTRQNPSACWKKPTYRPIAPVLVVGGPRSDYQQPEVDAIKKFVEQGGRALFMLDPPLKDRTGHRG